MKMQGLLESERRSAGSILRTLGSFQMRTSEDTRSYCERYNEILEGIPEEELKIRREDIFRGFIGGLTKDIYVRGLCSMAKYMGTAILDESMDKAIFCQEHKYPHRYKTEKAAVLFQKICPQR